MKIWRSLEISVKLDRPAKCGSLAELTPEKRGNYRRLWIKFKTLEYAQLGSLLITHPPAPCHPERSEAPAERSRRTYDGVRRHKCGEIFRHSSNTGESRAFQHLHICTDQRSRTGASMKRRRVVAKMFRQATSASQRHNPFGFAQGKLSAAFGWRRTSLRITE